MSPATSSILVLVGALIVLVGTALVLLGVLLRFAERSGDENVSAIGNSIIGVGVAVGFVGIARNLTTVELVVLGATAVALLVVLPVIYRRADPKIAVATPQPKAYQHECHGGEEPRGEHGAAV